MINTGWNLLVTGLPGCGKTTLLEECRRRLARWHPRGFLTHEIRQSGIRQGFELISIPEGRSAVLAHVDIRGPRQVGRYGVDLPAFENFLRVLDWDMDPTRPLIIDEIGKMECMSSLFRHLVQASLAAPTPVLGSLARHGQGFIRQIRSRPDINVMEITPANRNKLVRGIVTQAEGHLHVSLRNISRRKVL